MQTVIRYSSILIKFLLLASVNVVHRTVIIIIIVFFFEDIKYRYCLLKI